MNKGRARSGAFGLVPVPGSTLGSKAVGMRAAVGGRTVTIGELVALGFFYITEDRQKIANFQEPNSSPGGIK